MNRLTSLILIALLFAFSVSQTNAQDADTSMRMAVVDIQQLMSDSKAAQSIQTQGKALRDSYQQKIVAIETQLKEAEASILQKRQSLSEEEFSKEREKFQQSLIDGQREVQELNQKLDKSLGDALNQLRDEIVTIVSDYSTKEGYALVISRADVVIVAKSMDITAPVMAELNRKLTKITVKG